MSALEPGLYRATVRGVADVMVFIDGAGYGTTGDCVSNHRVHEDALVTDARPLIVLDLGGRIPSTVVDALTIASNGDHLYSADALAVMDIAKQVQAQLKPARIEEPGLWGVVEATYQGWHRGSWVHCEGGVWRSLRDDGHEWVTWTSLVDPTLIRKGVTE